MLVVVTTDGMRYAAEMLTWGTAEWDKRDSEPGLWFRCGQAMKFVKHEDILTIEWPGKVSHEADRVFEGCTLCGYWRLVRPQAGAGVL